MFTMPVKYLSQCSLFCPLLSPGMWPKPYTTILRLIALFRTQHPRLPTCEGDYMVEISGLRAAASPGVWKQTDISSFTLARRVGVLAFQISFLIEQAIIEAGVVIDCSSTGHGRLFDQSSWSITQSALTNFIDHSIMGLAPPDHDRS